MKKIKTLILFCLLIICSSSTNATHINGGFISYKSLGGNNYEITLVVYRDCFNGVPPFDNPAAIGVFDINNSLLNYYLVFVAPDSVNLFTPGDCIPTNLCFAKAHYTITISLPSNGIYTIVYQRCCRTQLIQNIQNPVGHGMTFFTTINTNNINNCAEFNTEIPGYAFVGDAFSYNASATDLDGDSLAYSLDYCYDGADSLNPAPQPPFAPPYNFLPFQVPYSLSNVFGGTVPLSIDAATGLMNATPGTIGVFQIGQIVDEYRNGALINSFRREFQVFISPTNYFSLSGNVSADNNTQPLDTGKLWLIRQNLYDSTLTAIDTNTVLNGLFNFPPTINGYYLAKSSADSTSIYYANNIPTYYGDVLFWHQATQLNLCNGNLQNIDIDLIQGINPGGPGFVGGLISQGANKLMSPGDAETGITVILYDISNQPVAYAITDANGFFSIGNLPLGTYKVYIDKLNWYIDNSLAPLITLTTATPVQNNLAFTLFSNRLELAGFVNNSGINTPYNSFSVSPNPANEEIKICYSLSDNSDVKIAITDVTGRKINSMLFLNQATGLHETVLNLGKAGKGIYFVSFKTKSEFKSLRLVIL